MNKLYVYIGVPVVVLTLLVGGFFALNNSTDREKQGNGEPKPVSAIWETYMNAEQGVSFQYPAQFDTRYIEVFDWPPQVQLLQEEFICTEAGSETRRAGKTEQLTIDNRTYCVTIIVEGAAGSIYTQYAYAFPYNNQTAIFTFSTRAPQCGNYSEPKKTECEAERETFDMDAIGDRMAQSLSQTPAPSPDGSPITIRGEITCLPKKGSGPHTLECAIGLRGEDGSHYALKNLFDHDPDYHFSTTGMQVEVAGIFRAKEASGPGGSSYDVAGVIEIISIREDTEGQETILREGQRESSFLLQDIYPNRVEGLNFPEYPIATGQGLPVTLRIGEVVSNGCTIRLTLLRIEGNTAVFEKETDFNRPCPICLSANTLVDTPFGKVAVQNLQKDDAVWTVDKSGGRVPGSIVKTGNTPTSLTQQMVHLIFDDGRELSVSPGHPVIDGRTVGNLAPGDVYDGASVVSVQRIPYGGKATYDILPSGDTGFYWANDILVGSTLR